MATGAPRFGCVGGGEFLTVTTLAERVEELRALAEKRGVADLVGDLPSSTLAVGAYAEVLGFDVALAHNLDLTLKEIEQLSPRR